MGKYDMSFSKMKLKDCISPDYNPRQISDSEFERLKKSIVKFGYSDPIIVNKRNNHIIAGNQRHRALTELNRENHGKYTEIDVVLLDLNPADEKAFNIGHNKIGGEFDPNKLEVLLDELEYNNYDMDLTGFIQEYQEVDLEKEVANITDEELVDVEPQYMLSVKCESQAQQDLLFEDLKHRGYKVKATKF